MSAFLTSVQVPNTTQELVNRYHAQLVAHQPENIFYLFMGPVSSTINRIKEVNQEYNNRSYITNRNNNSQERMWDVWPR